MELSNKRQSCSLLCILLGTAVFAGRTVAQEDTYGYGYHFTPLDVAIWDLSGAYSLSTMGCPTTFTLAQDNRGKLTAQGVADCVVNGLQVNAPFTVTGTIRQSRGAALVNMLIKFRGTGTDIEGTYRLRATDRITAEVDPATSSIMGTMRTGVVVGGDVLRETVPFEESLPTDVNGVSDLTISLTRTNNRLTGTAQLQLSNGDIYQFSVRGGVSTRANEDRLTLSSPAPERLKLRLRIDRTTGDIKVLTGRVLGQNLKATDIAGTITP